MDWRPLRLVRGAIVAVCGSVCREGGKNKRVEFGDTVICRNTSSHHIQFTVEQKQERVIYFSFFI